MNAPLGTFNQNMYIDTRIIFFCLKTRKDAQSNLPRRSSSTSVRSQRPGSNATNEAAWMKKMTLQPGPSARRPKLP